jgi:hypothetical protein
MHFFKYGRTALQIGSLGFFENIPSDMILEVTQYLEIKDLINFTLLTNKQLLENTRVLSEYDAIRVARLLGLEERVTSDAEVLKEMKKFTMVLMRLNELGILPNSNDLSEIFNYANLRFRTLILPNLTLMILSGKDSLKDHGPVMLKVVSWPKEYKIVLRYLTRDRYKCSRSQLIKHIKKENLAFSNFNFNYLLEYNVKSRTNVIIRDGIYYSLAVTLIISKLLYVYSTLINNELSVGDVTNYWIFLAVMAGISMNLYLNNRYEQYTE